MEDKNIEPVEGGLGINIEPKEELDIQSVKTQEEIQELLEEQPEDLTEEVEELTDEEKREQYVELLKESRIRFRNTVHDGNVTKTQFGPKYKQKRKRKNSLQKKSRKANRK